MVRKMAVAKMFAKGEFENNINPNSSIFEIDSFVKFIKPHG